MTQYKTLNVKPSKFCLDKLESRMKTCTEVTLNRWSIVTGDSNNKTNPRRTYY